MSPRKKNEKAPAKNMEVKLKKPIKEKIKKEKPKLKSPTVVKVKIRKTPRQPLPSSTLKSAKLSSTENAALRKIELANEVALMALTKPTLSFESEVKAKLVEEPNEVYGGANMTKVGSEAKQVKAKVTSGKKRGKQKKNTMDNPTDVMKEITERVGPPQKKFKDKPVKSKKNVIANSMPSKQITETTKKPFNMGGPESKKEKLTEKSQCKCDRRKYSKSGKNAGSDNAAASEGQNSSIFEHTSIKDKADDSFKTHNIESRKITSISGCLSLTEDISSSTTTTCSTVSSIDILKKDKKTTLPIIADICSELIPSAHPEDQPPAKDLFEITPAYPTETDPVLGDTMLSSSTSSLSSQSLVLHLSTSSSTSSIHSSKNIKDYTEKVKSLLEKIYLESNTSHYENTDPKITSLFLHRGLMKKFFNKGQNIVNAEKHIFSLCESLFELLNDESTESPVENANKDLEKPDSCPGIVGQQYPPESPVKNATKDIEKDLPDLYPGIVGQQRSCESPVENVNKDLEKPDSCPGIVGQQQPDKLEKNFLTANRVVIDENCEKNGDALLQKANKIISSGHSLVETFTTDQVKNTSFGALYNDDDVLTIYAESFSGMGSSFAPFPCASDADFEECVPQRFTYNPLIIDSTTNLEYTAACEKQNADLTSVDKVQKVATNISSNEFKRRALNGGDTFSKDIPPSSSKLNTQQKMLIAVQYKSLSVVNSAIFRGVCFFNLISNCKRARCTFAHVKPDIAEIKMRLAKVSDENFIQEYMVMRRFPILRKMYCNVYVKECQRREMTRILVEMSMDFIMKAENKDQKIFVTEQALLHLNNIDLSVCDDLLLYVVNKNILLCEVYMETLAETSNFSRFKQIFTKLAEFIVKHGKTFDLGAVKHILLQICSLPYEERIAKTLILLMKNTDENIFDMMMPFERLLLSNSAQELYSDVLASRRKMLLNKCTFTNVNKSLAGHVNQDKDMSLAHTDKKRSTSPHTTKWGNLIKTAEEPKLIRTIRPMHNPNCNSSLSNESDKYKRLPNKSYFEQGMSQNPRAFNMNPRHSFARPFITRPLLRNNMDQRMHGPTSQPVYLWQSRPWLNPY